MLAVSCVIAVILIFTLSYDLQRHKPRAGRRADVTHGQSPVSGAL